MKKISATIKTALSMAAIVGVASCTESKESVVVWGTVWATGIDGSKGIDSPDGLTLGEGGSDGYCRYQNNQFSFALGTKAPGHLESSEDYYLIVDNIEGPPSTKPYDKDGVPRSDENRTFTGGTVYTNLNSRSFTEHDMIEGQCIATLFAEAEEGDLTPVAYGKNRFQYLVNIDCVDGLEPQSDPVTPIDINGFSATLWFDNCE
jgi:hypothetical protein